MTAPELDKAEPLTNHEVALVKAVAEPLNAEISRLAVEVAELRHQLDMLRADFNDCNSERARWQARATAAEQKLEAAERDTIERCISMLNSKEYYCYNRAADFLSRALANQGEGNG